MKVFPHKLKDTLLMNNILMAGYMVNKHRHYLRHNRKGWKNCRQLNGQNINEKNYGKYIRDLRRLQLGCSVGGCWFGACWYADDLIILAPYREVLQRMLDICEAYAVDHNLTFSTDPVPARSKTKCIYFCGRPGHVRYPQPVQLGGKDQPWMESADHLGHCVSQVTNMEKDCQRARAIFIRKS